LELREHRPARCRVLGRQHDGQVLQPRHGLDNLERQTDVVLDAQPGRPPSQIQHVLGRRRAGIGTARERQIGVAGLWPLRARQPPQRLVEGPDHRATHPLAGLVVSDFLLQRRCRSTELMHRVLDRH